MKPRQQTPKDQSGRPGAGKGRREDVHGSGIYPASGPMPKGPAVVRTESTLVRKEQPKRGGGKPGASS